MRLLPASLVVLAAVAWAGLLAAAPVLAAGAGDGGAVFTAAWVYRAGSVVCHQQRARSFAVAGSQMPVCARCAGLYAGAAIGASAIFAWAAWRGRRPLPRAVVPLSRARRIVIACAAPTLLAWAVEHGAGLGVPGPVRAVIALPLGAAVATVVTLWAGGARFHDTPAATAIH